MTVEAAMIMPMVLCVMVVLIYTAFFLYDRCLYDQDAYLLCLHEAIRKDAGGRADPAQITEQEAGQFGSKYVAVSSIGGSARLEQNTLIYEGNAKVVPAVFTGSALMPEGIMGIQVSSRSTRMDMPFYIRKYRRLGAVGRQILSGTGEGS